MQNTTSAIAENQTAHTESERILPGIYYKPPDTDGIYVRDSCMASKRVNLHPFTFKWKMKFTKNKYYSIPGKCHWVRKVFDSNNNLQKQIEVDTRPADKRTCKFEYYCSITRYANGRIFKKYYIDGTLYELISNRRAYLFHENGSLKSRRTGKDIAEYYSNGSIRERASGRPYAKTKTFYTPFGEEENKARSSKAGIAQSAYSNGNVFEQWIYRDGKPEKYRKFERMGRLLESRIEGQLNLELIRKDDGKLEKIICEITGKKQLRQINYSDVRNAEALRPHQAMLVKTFNKHGKPCMFEKMLNYTREGRKYSFDGNGKPKIISCYFGGVSIDPKFYEYPENMAVEDVFHERNLTKRSIYIRLMGYSLFLSKLKKYDTIDSDGDYSLLAVGFVQDDEPIYLLKVKCASTGVYYTLRVPPTMRTCAEAVSWTFDMSPEEYQLSEET